MTLGKFISRLTTPARAVSFPEGGPTLRAANGDLLAQMLADALPRLIPASAEVRSGWQTESLIDAWRGQHVWWLIVDDDLVRVHAAAVENSQGRKKRSARFFPLRRAAPNISVSYGSEFPDLGAREIAIVVGMDVDLPTGAEPFKAEAGVEHVEKLAAFVDHLQLAIARSRVGGGR